MSISIILYTLDSIFNQLNDKTRKDDFINIGFVIGLAALLYLPNLWLLASVIFSLMLFSNIKPINIISIVFSALLVFLLTTLFFYLFEAEQNFWLLYLCSIYIIPYQFLISGFDLLKLFFFVLFLVGFTIFTLSGQTRYTNYQYRSQLCLIIWIFLGIISGFFNSQVSSCQFIVVFPAISTLLSHYFLSYNYIFVREFVFSSLLLQNVFFSYQSLILKEKSSIISTKLFLKPISNELPFKNTKNNKIWVLGNDYDFYNNQSLPMAYLDWDLTKFLFGRLNNYSTLSHIYTQFEKNPPDYIADPSNYFPKIIKVIPVLEKHYQYIKEDNIYKRVK